MALQYTRGGYLSSRHIENDADAAKKLLEPALAEMARQIAECRKSHTNPPVCKTCHSSQTPVAFTPSQLHPGPKRVGGDATIARQPPAFTPTPTEGERRRTPRDTGRSTSSGSDQVTRGAPAGSSGSAMDRLGGGGTGGAPSGGGGSGGAAAKPSGGGGGASSAPSSGGSSPNINSNTIMKQAPAFGQSPGLR